jgi:DNA-binding response OmpR family regulator
MRVESNNRPFRTYAREVTTAAPIVLLVDDEAVVLRMLEVNLRIAGFEVRTASTGRAALRAAETEPPDAVVLDLGLPDLNGWDVLEQLQRIEGVARAPVIVLSGLDRDAVGERGYAAPVYAYLTKPVEPALLIETLRGAVSRAGA